MQFELSCFSQFFAGLPVVQRVCIGRYFTMAGGNVDSAKFQMPTAAEQAFACIGMPARLEVKGWWGRPVRLRPKMMLQTYLPHRG